MSGVVCSGASKYVRRVVLILLTVGGLASINLAQEGAPQPVPAETPAPKKSNVRPATPPGPSAIEPFDGVAVTKMAESCVTFDTEAGPIEIELLPGAAPETVRNFLNLTAIGFFDTTTFSRIVKGFVIQGGNITTSERLTPQLIRRASRTIIDEPNSIKHERGIVSMARAASPNTATTSFFILAGAAPHLDRTFAAFGRVLRGMDTVDAINGAPAENETPDNPVRIKRAIITRCPPPAVVTPTPPPALKEPADER